MLRNTWHHYRRNKRTFGYQIHSFAVVFPMLTAQNHIRARIYQQDTGQTFLLIQFYCSRRPRSCVCWKRTLPRSVHHRCPYSYTPFRQHWGSTDERYPGLKHSEVGPFNQAPCKTYNTSHFSLFSHIYVVLTIKKYFNFIQFNYHARFAIFAIPFISAGS